MRRKLLVAVAIVGLVNSPGAFGQSFSLSISTPHSVVPMGDPIRVDVVLINVADHEISRPPISTPMCDYRIDVDGKTGRRISEPNCSGSRLKGLPLKPEESIAAHMSLAIDIGATAKLDFSMPGDYVIQFSRWDPNSARTIKSNKITVKVLPTNPDPE